MDTHGRWWASSPEAAARALETDLRKGLGEQEARRRLERFGPNRLPERGGLGDWALLRRQFSSLVFWILAAAGGVAIAIGERLDAGAIFTILALNALIGFLQERKAETSLAALRRLSAPSCRAVREGVPRALPAAQLVRGDLVELEAGDKVPADGRVVWVARLRTQEAALTGESLPVDKTARALEDGDLGVADRANMAFLGTAVVAGKGLMIVTATGLDTELGRVAELLGGAGASSTPLEEKIERFVRRLAVAFLAALALLALARGRQAGELLFVFLSLAVAAIPEGLPVVVTVSLALGVQKMASRGALVRRLASVETLGSAGVVCTDKTGTLTGNEMTAREVWIGGRRVEVGGQGYSPEGTFSEAGEPRDPAAWGDLAAALRVGVLCNGAHLLKRDGRWEIAGDPTEGALLALGAKAGLWKQELERRLPAEEEIPFDSERKRMSVLRRDGGRRLLFVKGAPDVLLGLSTLDGPARERVAAAAEEMGARALRVLALAYRELGGGTGLEDGAERELTFAGMVGMMDPPRQEAAAAVASCRAAGVRPVMVTGDHKATALAVARELRILKDGERVLTGRDLDSMDDAELRGAVRSVSVYARVSSEHKLRIVRAWKAEGETVAMTGDGINDAPALKEADIGVAMGLSGTDVAREASDLVITDDNFASIVAAIERGRGIYDNIQKAVVYLVTGNIAELLVIGAPLLAGLRYADGGPLLALSATHILWVNLVTDGLPALALANDPPDPAVMSRPPRSASEPLIPGRLSLQMAARSLLDAAGVLVACFYGAAVDPATAQSMALTCLVVTELLWAQLLRRAFGAPISANPAFLAAVGSVLALQCAVLYVPWLSRAFGTRPLSADGWLLIGLIAALEWVLGTALNRALAPRPGRDRP